MYLKMLMIKPLASSLRKTQGAPDSRPLGERILSGVLSKVNTNGYVAGVLPTSVAPDPQTTVAPRETTFLQEQLENPLASQPPA